MGKTTFIQSALGRPVEAPSDIFPAFQFNIDLPNDDGTSETIPVCLFDSPAFKKDVEKRQSSPEAPHGEILIILWIPNGMLAVLR